MHASSMIIGHPGYEKRPAGSRREAYFLMIVLTKTVRPANMVANAQIVFATK
jgi:hypothetical protein